MELHLHLDENRLTIEERIRFADNAPTLLKLDDFDGMAEMLANFLTDADGVYIQAEQAAKILKTVPPDTLRAKMFEFALLVKTWNGQLEPTRTEQDQLTAWGAGMGQHLPPWVSILARAEQWGVTPWELNGETGDNENRYRWMARAGVFEQARMARLNVRSE